MTATTHLQFWDERPPTRKDILLALVNSLNLLAVALPIALQNVSREPVDSQMAFWYMFSEFEQETDLTGLVFNRDKIVGKLLDWAEVANLRIDTPRGSLDAEIASEGECGKASARPSTPEKSPNA